MTRILLYTGKGGVGKTSVAAATAVLSAQRGVRTLVVSTDIAHSLADALDTPVGPTPREIAPNLWAHEPDVFFNISRYWRTIQSYFASLFSWGGLDEVMAEEMTVLPGMDELGNLLWIGDHVDRAEYDLIVVDAAPTGETLRLLSLPEASRWWIEKIAPIGRRVQKLGGPLLRRMVGVPLPSADVYDSAERLLERLKYVHDLLSNPESSSVRLVLNLEKVSIQEAQRSFTYFHLYGYPTDLIVANRVLPAASGAYFDAWREAQSRYLPMVQEQFAPVPVRTIPYFDHEMVGLERLAELGRALFADSDPSAFLYRGRPYSVQREDGGYTLAVELPFTSKEEISLSRSGDELLLQVGGWRRNLVLPRLLLDAPTLGARMEDRVLKVRFAEPVRSTAGGSRDG
ncbi:MAG: ArsA family ATPase [Candidatus Limnocylindrales bacterium]